LLNSQCWNLEKVREMMLSDSRLLNDDIFNSMNYNAGNSKLSLPAQVFTVQEMSNIRLEAIPKTAELEQQEVIL